MYDDQTEISLQNCGYVVRNSPTDSPKICFDYKQGLQLIPKVRYSEGSLFRMFVIP